MTLEQDKEKDRHRKERRKKPRKRLKEWDFKSDHSATYIRTDVDGEKEQVYKDRETGRFYTKDSIGEKYILVPKKEEGVIEKRTRPEEWKKWRMGKAYAEGGRLEFFYKDEHINRNIDGQFWIYDKHTRGYIHLPKSEESKIVTKVHWAEGYDWGSSDGRVHAKKGWWSGGEGSSHEIGEIYVDGNRVEVIHPTGIGRSINISETIEIAQKMATELKSESERGDVNDT